MRSAEPRSRKSQPAPSALLRSLGLAVAATVLLAGAAQAEKLPGNARPAVFQNIDADGNLLFKVAGLNISATLHGVTLEIGADSEIQRLLFNGTRIHVVFVKKGAIPEVKIWYKPNQTLQEYLLKEGYATKLN